MDNRPVTCHLIYRLSNIILESIAKKCCGHAVSTLRPIVNFVDSQSEMEHGIRPRSPPQIKNRRCT